jgi:post-segregation antitoxin (ccd killing protein)
LGFYASELMAEQLKEAAREQDRSVSAVIRQALEAELRREAEGRHRDQGRPTGP